MKPWFGKIRILYIRNEPPPGVPANDTVAFRPLEEKAVRFVHYPDCQQLIIWLPANGQEYIKLRLLDTVTDLTSEEWPVTDQLSGSIQVLWDTLPVPPGQYLVEILHQSGGRHLIGLVKYEAGNDPPETPAPGTSTETSQDPIVYRNGFGQVMENEDLRLRERVMKEIVGRFTRHVEYESSGRSGTVYYTEGETRIPFYYEIGGGDCVAYIEIPPESQWETATKTSLERRDDIIHFLAQSVHARQAPHCRMEISADTIKFLRK